MRFGYKCPLILTAAAAAVIYTVTGFSFINDVEPEIPEISRIAAVAETGAAPDVTDAPAQTETVQIRTETAAGEDEQDTVTAAVQGDTEDRDTKLPEKEERNEDAPETGEPSETEAENENTAPGSESTADEAAPETDLSEAEAAQTEDPVTEISGEDPAGTPAEAQTGAAEAAGDPEDVPEQEHQEAAALAQAAGPQAQPAAAEAGEKPWEKGVVHTATDTVDASYFADALFIGDSRTVGLSQYCPELDEQAEFYAKISLTVKAALDKPFVKTEDGKKTVDELLSDGRQFGKVYIMLGINEVAGGTDESFAAEYSAMIDRIREKQPNAMIFIQSIMHVTKRKSDNDGHINNPRIDSRNAAIARLADAEKGIYYVDINQAVDDGEGNLIADLSFDEIHLKAVSYGLWYDFLKTHAHV